MSDRYTRIYADKQKFYAKGSPVIVFAHALLKDNSNGKVVAQIKFRSVARKTIKAVMVKLRTFDVSGNESEGVSEFQYLDLNVSTGGLFGAQTPVVLPDKTTRKITVEVTEVIFDDGKKWQYKGNEWGILPTQEVLYAALGAELAEQYRRDTDSRSNYLPLEYEDLWFCSCGRANKNANEKCYNCGLEKEVVFAATDIERLKANKEKYDNRYKDKYEKLLNSIKAKVKYYFDDFKETGFKGMFDKFMAASKKTKLVSVAVVLIALIIITTLIISSLSININKGSISLRVAESKTLKCSSFLYNKDLAEWTSSDTEIATVDSTGVVTGVSPGTCTITLVCGGQSDTCKVRVDSSHIKDHLVVGTWHLSFVGDVNTGEIYYEDPDDPLLQIVIDENLNYVLVPRLGEDLQVVNGVLQCIGGSEDDIWFSIDIFGYGVYNELFYFTENDLLCFGSDEYGYYFERV